MRTHITEVTLYSFEELSEQAQNYAIEKESQAQSELFDASDYIIDDIKTLFELFGLNIDRIYYSGFWSQGDGACFEGSYRFKKGGLQALKDYAPRDIELHDLVRQLNRLSRDNFYRMSFNTVHRGHYYHENSMNIECDRSDIERYNEITVVNEDDIHEVIKDLARYIYKCIRYEYESVTSYEVCKEHLQYIDCEYTVEGCIQ